MKIVFMGTPDFAVPTIKALVQAGHDVELVVSQPDRPVGRGLETKPTPIKKVAQDLGLAVVQPETLKDPEIRERLETISPEAIVVAAYGKILPKWLLDLPKEGCLNVHGSILPAYRGAAPIQRALMDGVEETGITIMRMDEGMDTGDMLLVRKLPVGPDETAGELTLRMAEAGAKAMVETLDKLSLGELEVTPQDSTKATYAPKVEKEDAAIDWSASCVKIKNLVRAMNPSPGAYTTMNDRRVKILKVKAVDVAEYLDRDTRGTPATGWRVAPGLVVALDADLGPIVACGDGALALVELQPAGKRAMSGAEFTRGRYVAKGDRFGR